MTEVKENKCQLCEKKACGHCSGCNPQEPQTNYWYCEDHLNMHDCRIDEPCNVCGDSQSDTFCEEGCKNENDVLGNLYFCWKCFSTHQCEMHEED